LFVVYYPSDTIPPTDYSKHAHTCHMEVCLCLELHQVTDTDLRRLKFKLLNKKAPDDDDDNYKMNVFDSTESTDTMTFINNEQSIIVNCHCVFS